MSKGGRYTQKKTNHSQGDEGRKPVALIVVAIVLVFVVAGLIGGIVYNLVMDKSKPQLQAETTVPMSTPETVEPTVEMTEQTQETTEPTTVPTTLPYKESGMDIINVLMVGKAARDGEEIAEGHHLTARSERIARELINVGRRCHTHRTSRS